MGLPERLTGTDRVRLIRDERRRAGRLLAVLDDDPTGSQAVHDVQIVTELDRAEYARALVADPGICFVLTNTRGMPEQAAVELTTQVAGDLFEVARSMGRPLDIVSRGDSTLRGHVVAEVRALDAVKRAHDGRGYDAVVFAPAFFEAGRVTEDDVQWVIGDDGARAPVGRTEYARDPSFGYRASELKEFLAERSAGAIRASDVRSVSLRDLREGGVERVVDLLRGVPSGSFVVVNATTDADYDTFVLGALRLEDEGRSFLYRTGPSFVRALGGIAPSEPLRFDDIWPDGPPSSHGLVVVGSHVPRTSAQLERLSQLDGLASVELDAAALGAADADIAGIVDRAAERVRRALPGSDVVISTSRSLVTGVAGSTDLEVAMTISNAVSSVVAAALDAGPAWVVAKGGITSHDVAVRGLGIRRATVVGQFGRGIVSLYRPESADPRAVGMPYVVFPGNVGSVDALAHVVGLLRGASSRARLS